MRNIGHLNQEAMARRFGEYLYSRGVDNQVEPEEGGHWTIWILDDDDMDKASSLLAEFEKEPLADKYIQAEAVAAKRREEDRRREESYRRRQISGAQLWSAGNLLRWIPATLVLIAVSLVVFVLTEFVGLRFIERLLLISEYYTRLMLPEVRGGQVWRLFSPMFLHGGIIHILFNMMWLFDFGNMIERKEGTARFLILVFSVSILSNLGEYLVTGPLFGGMSGVVYGLFGYIWMRSKIDSRTRYALHPNTVIFLFAWFFICLLNVFPGFHVANVAHAVGLGTGIAWGWFRGMKDL